MIFRVIFLHYFNTIRHHQASGTVFWLLDVFRKNFKCEFRICTLFDLGKMAGSRFLFFSHTQALTSRVGCRIFRASPKVGSYFEFDWWFEFAGFRIHQVGIIVMVIPLCVFELPSLFRIVSGHIPIGTLMDGKQLRSFLILSIVNGFAFTHYK